MLLLLVAAAAVIGFAPYAMFLRRFQVLILTVSVAVAVVTAVFRLRNFRTFATARPSFGEYLLGAWNGVAFSSTFTLAAMLVYWLVQAVALLIGAVAGWFESDWRPASGFWAFWISLASFAVFGLGALMAIAEEIPRRLYPNTAGTRSAYYSLLVERRRLTRMVAIAALALVVLLLIFRPPTRWFAVSITLYLLYTGAVLDQLCRVAGEAPDKQRVLKALRKLLEAAGYATVASPRTGSSEIDPLISTVDLLASAPGRTLAIEVKVPKRNGGPVGWHEASRLKTAAWALEDTLAKQSSEFGAVVPLLILAGREKAPSLERFLADVPVQVVGPTDTDLIAKIETEVDVEKLRALAASWLDIEAVATAPGEAPMESA